MRTRMFALTLIALVSCLAFSPAGAALAQGTPMEFEGLQATVFGSPAADPAQTRIMVVTHGDSGGGDYMLGLAQDLAAPGVVSMVLARPGCTVQGRRSEGSHNFKKGDHYTSGNISAVNDALAAMKERYGTDRIYMLGHSGGAATAALVLGKYPETLKGAVMVSLPAHVKRWRTYRNKQRGKKGSGWKRSLSPHNYVDNIAPDAQVVVVVGEKDSNTPPWLAQIYVDEARAEGKKVTLIQVPGAPHNLSTGDGKAQAALNAARGMLGS